MTRKMISWLAGMAVFLIFHSCRQESLLQDNDFYNNQSKYRVYTINKQQVKNDFFLFDKVAGIQNRISGKAEKSFGKDTGKSIQDSLLTGAVIGMNKILVVENNGEKTYTFALKRNYPSSKTENLVLKKNPDSTFTGKLIQYDVTLQEKELFNAWHSIDLKDRVKVYNIENLNIPSSSGRIGSTSFGCFTVVYEDGTCSGQEHHAYGDSTCPLIGTAQQAGAPRILSITEIPGCGSGGGSSGSSTGTADPVQPGGGGGDNGLTIIFDDIDLNYYSSDNMTDPDFVFWSQVNQFVQGQPQVVRDFNSEYHFVYYYMHAYFKNNGGLTQANKNFVSQRLLALSTWYFDLTKAPYLNTDQRLSLAIWSEKYLLEHPDMTWAQFENSFLMNPCEKIKAKFEDPKFKEKVAAIDKSEVFNYDHEMGYAAGYPPANTGVTGTQYPPMENVLGSHSVKLPDGNQYFGYIHSHNNESNGGHPIKIFSPYDVITFLTSCVRNADEHGSIGDAYCMVITSEGNYILQYSGIGDYNIGPNQIQSWKKWYKDNFEELARTDELTQPNVEKTFAQFLTESVNINGLEVYHVEKNTGKASKLNTNGTKTPCP